jgi:hypothetical protein
MDIQTEKRDVGRPYKVEAIGRLKLTTSVQGSLKKWLKEYATNTGQTIADILEDAIIEYRTKHDPKKGN